VARIADGIPLGQPILVGHHSERRARKDAEKIQGGMRKAVRLWETSQYWERRAKGALHHAKYKELPGVRQRRIKGLESDVRRQEKRIKESTGFLKLWSREGLTAEAAQKIANVDHGTGVDAWYRLDRVRKDGSAEEVAKVAADVVAKANESHTRAIETAKRWLAHLGLRLTYERAMLGDIPERVKPKRALLPMANYPGDGFEPMTKAQWAGIHADYKGSRIVGGARVRTAIVRHALVGVYLTDSKRVDPPGEGGDAVPRFKERSEPEPRATFTHTVEKPAPTPFDAMKASLKAGVQVVSAPQLFPTPPELAERVAELANIQPGERVLEPSAGTGSLLRAVLATTPDADVVAVEISADLARALAPKPGDGRYSVRHADFLTLGPSELGTFDCVVMNPPFASGADVKHILHARTLLKPDGRIVAICANGPRQRAALQPLADTWEELPEGTFQSSGTNVRTVLLTMRADSGDKRATRRSTMSAQPAASEPSS
jgi:protein-L-isoaspartate O-methyltransferase